jgi:general secretion pathway protein H
MPTFRVRTCKQKSLGFTLVELLVTLGIIAFVVAIAIPKLGRTLGTQLRATTRRVVSLNKELHHFARLKNKTYRLVIDFGDSNHKPSFDVESATTRQLLNPPDATPPPEKKKKDDKNKKPEDEDPFAEDSEVLKKKIDLPYGVQFEDVETDNVEKPITEGKAYVVFFPEGLVQRAIIHLTDGKNIHWSLIINPLTGQTTVETEYIKLKDLDKS